MIKWSEAIDSSQQSHGELGAVELVEPRSAVVDEGEFGCVGQGLPYHAGWYGKVPFRSTAYLAVRLLN